MALKNAITFKGLTATDGYIKISQLQINKDSVSAIITIYASEEQRHQNNPLDSQEVAIASGITDLSDGILSGAYVALKAQEYPEAVDC